MVLYRSVLPATNLNSNHAPLVNQYGVFKTSGAFFVIPPLYANVLGYAIDLYFFISTILVAWFTTDPEQLAGRIPGTYQFPPTAKAVCIQV